eukprot:281523_1
MGSSFTLGTVKPAALSFVPKETRLSNEGHYPTSSHSKSISISASSTYAPLLQHAKRTTVSQINTIWKHYISLYEKKRLKSLAPYFTELPEEILQLVLEYEYDTESSYQMFVTNMYRAINKMYILPWMIGWVQVVINALVLSQIYKPIFRDSIHFNLLYSCGIIMLVTSVIQLMGVLIILCFIYDKNHKQNQNIRKLALLKGFMFFENPSSYLFNEHNGWELFIEFEKWCNVLYVTDLLNRKMTVKGRLFTSDVVWMYLCKPLYCIIYAIFLIMQTVQIVMWIWIPFIILLWYLSLHTYLQISSGYTLFCCLTVGALSYCAGVFFHSIIMDNITFNKGIELTMFVNSGIVGGICLVAIICLKFKPISGIKQYWTLNWIFISFLFTTVYICELGINIFYHYEYQYTILMCGFRLFGMYCWYLSFNLGIFISGNCHKYKNFNQSKFITCCWLFAWFDLHWIHGVFHKPMYLPDKRSSISNL